MAFQRSPWTLLGQNPDEDLAAQIGLMPSQVNPDPQIDASVSRSPASSDVMEMGKPSLMMGPPAPQAPKQYFVEPASITPNIQGEELQAAQPERKEKGSGETERDKAMNEAKREWKNQTLNMMSPEQVQQAYGTAANLPVFQDQQAGIDQLRQMAALAAQQKPQLDLSPIMALADAQTGSHLAASYQRPESAQQRLQEAMSAAQKIQQDQRDLSKNILDSVAKQKGGYLTDLQQQLARSGIDLMAQDPSIKRSLVQPVNNFMTQTRQESQKMREDDSQLQKVLVAVNSGNPAEQKGVPLQIARLIEGARPAMAAAAVESGDPSLVERITATATKLSTGQLTPENVGQYTQFVRDMQKVNDLAKRGLIKRWTTSGMTMGLDPEAINGMIPADWLAPYSGQTATIMKDSPKPQNVQKPHAQKAAPAQGAGPAGAMSFEQWKAAQGH